MEKKIKDEILQALSRGYCHPENSDKQVDSELIESMASEVMHSFFDPKPSINLDGDCECGHKSSQHGKSMSINYTRGRCMKCECKNFLDKI